MHNKRLTVVLILSVLFSLLNSELSNAQASPDSPDWQLTGQAGGPTQGIAVQGNFAYIGVGPRLVVVDISDPANPQRVGESAVLADFVRSVAVSGTYAFVAAGGAGLCVVDISSPTHPLEVGAWDSPGYAEGVAVAGSTAYLADGPGGLWLVDISDPTGPSKIASVFDMNYVYNVAVNGRYAYLAAGGAGLLVVDISNPAYPVEVSGYDTPGNAHALTVLNSRAYVADECSGLQIINVADPLHPALLGALQAYGWTFDVAVSGSNAYLANAFGGLRILNVLDPTHPLEVGSLSWAQGNGTGLVVAGSRIYLADRKNGLRVISTADPAHPAQSGFFSPFQSALMMVIGGDYAYVAAGYNGVRILDIKDPSHPVEAGAYPIDGIVYTLKLAGSRLYAGTFGGSPAWGAYVLDISDPTNPVQLSYGQWCGECHGIDVVGNTAYFDDTNGVSIVDFADPAHPQLLGNTNENAITVTVSGHLAYVTQGAQLKIYDVSDPAHITVFGTYSDPLGFLRQNVVLTENYAYVNDWWGVRILNVADPAHPTAVAFYPTPPETEWLAVSDDRLYIAEGSYGVEVVDVSNPAVPVRLSGFATLGSARTVAVAGGNLFVASTEGGLQIYSLASLAAAQPGVDASGPAPAGSSPVAHSPSTPQHQQKPPAITLPLLASPAAPDRAATTCTVTSAADSGLGTLRECLWNQVNGDVINFSPVVFPPSAPVTIQVGPERLSWLVMGNITLDASNAGVILDGTGVTGAWDPGIGIASDNNVVRGLQIYHFPGMGISVMGYNNIIGGSRLIGSGPTGQGNVISSNRMGLTISDQGNQILGNIIGLKADGMQAFGNQTDGINIWGSQNDIIGSLEAGKNNIISANGATGITLCGYVDEGIQILGNYIGTDISGTLDRGNTDIGVYLECGAYNNLVHSNLVSANHGAGVVISDIASDFNVITGNRIGVTGDGAQTLPNAGVGIMTLWGAYTRIGGTAPGDGNQVGTGTVEVNVIFGSETMVQGNKVGLNAAGTAVLPNAGSIVLDGSSRTILGGATPAEANYVTTVGNFSLNIHSVNNAILGNFFGLAVDGTSPLAGAGFQILSQHSGNLIQNNHIVNAGSAGIWLDRAQANTIRRNSIYANPFKGIFLDNGANNNLSAPSFSLSVANGSGTTCPGCMVELFLDAGNQGRFYLDSVTANSSGSFTFPAYCPLPYPNLTATATNSLGDTSEFSAPQVVPWNCSSNPAPALFSINPTSVNEQDPTTVLTLIGSGFFPGSVVQLNGNTLLTHYVDSNHLFAVLPLGQIGISGDTSITVFNSTPDGGTSNAVTLTIVPVNPVPILAFLIPSSATAGDAAFTLTVSGGSFINGSVVRWNGIDRTTMYVSTTQLTASITAADIASAGTIPVTVFNPATGGGISNSIPFTILAHSRIYMPLIRK
ncbi:MAG TPA: right-handed parallel beta-helix repeat-containing protein [Longilinea sp.]|nr:right-handed parallel beta-helix repeat-containing protein [Longilinea sp.]